MERRIHPTDDGGRQNKADTPSSRAISTASSGESAVAAAKHSCCHMMDVVALAQDARLSRVGRDGQASFLSVLDAEEVRPLLTGPAYEVLCAIWRSSFSPRTYG